MNNNIKISILVPICNVENFLNQCLNSLINQTLQNIEIICVNDGSTDTSLQIINRFAEIDNRIVVLDKKNSGYGDSMNKGLAIARGEYIGIVESDDFACPNMFEELYKIAKENNADLVKSNFYMYWGESDKKNYTNALNINDKINDIEIAREKLFFAPPSIWSAIYRRQYLIDNNICFLSTPGASYQDISFHFKAVATAKKLVITPKAFLNYRQDNANSSVKIANKEKIMCLNKEYDEIRRFIFEHRLEQILPIYCTLRFCGYMWNYFRISDEIKIFYWNVIVNEIKNHGDEWSILPEKLGKFYTMYGGYKLIVNNKKIFFDVLVKISKLKENMKKIVNKGQIHV